jgi:2,5-diamino-6-(ribosylamino)-4(3H)-pyrimidinone 5'-phosphate reductase
MTHTIAESRRPRVICHMAASIDGRIVADRWPDAPAVRREYEQIHASYAADGWMCGRVTMEPFAGGQRSDADVAREYAGPAREDFGAPGAHESFAVAIDPRGRLAWESNDIDGDHVITVLCERVSDEYLAFLRERGVSFVLAGKNEVDLALALEKIGARFGVRTLMLEGGGRVNGGMLAAGLIDELSVLVVPVADGRVGTPAVFDVERRGAAPRRLRLETVERRSDDMIWLRYRLDNTGELEDSRERGATSRSGA